MEFTISRINKQNKLLVSKKTTERFLERIAKDDAKQSVQNFRMSAPLMNGNYEYYNTHSKDKKNKGNKNSASGRKGRADILQMKKHLLSRYQFRYNAVMKYTEYRSYNSWVWN